MTIEVHEWGLGVGTGSILPLRLSGLQSANVGWWFISDVRRHISENKFKSVSLGRGQISSIDCDEGTPTSEARKVGLNFFPVVLGEVKVDYELFIEERVFEIDRQFDETLPDVQLVGDSNEGLE